MRKPTMKLFSVLMLGLVGLTVAQRGGGGGPPPPGGRRPPPGGRGPPPGGRGPPPQNGGGFGQPGQSIGNSAGSSVTDSALVDTARQLAQRGICQSQSMGGPGGGGQPKRTRFGRQALPRGPGGQGGPGGGQCAVVEGQCGKGLSSVYHEELISVNGQQMRLVVTNGIPSHVYHDYTGTNRRQNPNEACRNPTYMLLPLNPRKGSFSESSLGPVGVASSGAFFYNHKDAQNQVAATTEGDSFDNCNGHADPMCRFKNQYFSCFFVLQIILGTTIIKPRIACKIHALLLATSETAFLSMDSVIRMVVV